MRGFAPHIPLAFLLLLSASCADGRASDRDAGFTPRIDAALADAWAAEGVDAAPPDAALADAAPPDAAPPDAAPPDVALPDAATEDAAPPRPPFTVRYLANGGTAWASIALSSDAPSAPIEAAMGIGGTPDIVVLTRTEFFVFNTVLRTFSERRTRTSVFPELSTTALGDGYSIGDGTTSAMNVTVMSRSGDAWVYAWNHAARRATLDHYVAVTALSDDWRGPLAPPTHEMHGFVFVPENSAGWGAPDPARTPCAPPVAPTIYGVGLGWDGALPRTMRVGIQDGSCLRFVNAGAFGPSVYPPFGMPGVTADPFTIDALAWSNGLWMFTHE